MDNNLIPVEGHEDVGPKVFEILNEILSHKQDLGLPSKWNRAYELTRNRHWKTDKTRRGRLVSANLLHKHRTNTVSILTDNSPTFNIPKVGLGDNEEQADYLYGKLQRVAEYWWGNTEQQRLFELTVADAEQYGCYCEKVIFNPDLESGLGEVETVLIAPWYYGVYPIKQNGLPDVQKAEAFLHYYPMSTREARRRWPDLSDQIQSDTEILKLLEDSREEMIASARGASGILTTYGSVIKKLINTLGMAGDDEDEVLVVECWVKDYTIEGGGSKYPGFIRKITCCSGGTVVLEDLPNPSINPNIPIELAANCYLFDKFPATIANSIVDSSTIWGMTDYEQLEQLVMEVNKRLTQLSLVTDSSARNIFINPQGSGVENAEIGNMPSVIRPTITAAQMMRYVDPPRVDPTLVNSLEIYKELFFQVAGTFDLQQANAAGNDVIAYKAIAALLENASRLHRTKTRNYTYLIRERGRMFISHAQNWYTEDRWFTWEEDGEEMSDTVRNTEILFPAKLTVVSGSTMPRSRVQEREEALALFGQGAIDQEALLKSLDFPDWKKIVARMKEGPVGEMVGRLAQLGAPEPLVAFLQEIFLMDPKKFEQAAKRGELPSIQQVLQMLMTGEQPADPEMQLKGLEVQSKAQLSAAQAEKAAMETRLINEKIVTERVNQWQTAYGVRFDEEMLEMKRAELMMELRQQQHQMQMDASNQQHQIEMDGHQRRMNVANAVMGAKKIDNDHEARTIKAGGPYREQGMASNNVRQ